MITISDHRTREVYFLCFNIRLCQYILSCKGVGIFISSSFGVEGDYLEKGFIIDSLHMMILDYLIAPYKIRWVREMINFVIIVGGIFLLGMVVMFNKAIVLEWEYMHSDIYEMATSSDMLKYVANTQSVSMKKTNAIPETKLVLENIQGMSENNLFDYDLASHLETKLPTYTLAFNTIVPDNRLMVPSLDIDVSIVDVSYASQEKLATADFHEELTKGVVRYPFTALPGSVGNSLIFGHSSVDGWEADNPFGFVFYQLPKINLGEDIHIVREGKLHTYTVEEKVVKHPDEVSDELVAYKDDIYLTLMACYPLFSDARRMLVRAKYKKSDTHSFVKNDAVGHMN